MAAIQQDVEGAAREGRVLASDATGARVLVPARPGMTAELWIVFDGGAPHAAAAALHRAMRACERSISIPARHSTF